MQSITVLNANSLDAKDGQLNDLLNTLISYKENIVWVSIHMSHLCLLTHVDCGLQTMYADVVLSHKDQIWI